MNKIISYLAIVVLSVAGFSAFAKEVTSEPQKTLSKVEAQAAELAAGIEKIQKQLSELDAQKNDRMKVEIERDRKGIEFWFALLSIITTVIAFGGGFIPYLMGRKDKERLQSELEEARRLVASIKEKHTEAVQKLNALPAFTSGSKPKPDETAAVQAEIKTISENPDQYSELDKLRAKAVKASLVKNPSAAQALSTFELWKAISVLDPKDAIAHFNSGYWAHELADLDAIPGAKYWCQQASEKYALALSIESGVHEAASNWGIALSKEASEVAKIDLVAAQNLWRQAGEKYALALSIKSDKHGAANNWGIALSKEANEVAKTDLSAAQKLWQEAQLLLERHSSMDEHGRLAVAYNLACLYGLQDKALDAVVQLEICRMAENLPGHWRTDTDLDPIRDSVEYKTWYKTHFGDAKT